MIDYYKILNVPQDASQDLIRKAFRKSAKHTHPDLFPGDTPAEKKKRQVLFVQLTQAYEILSDEKRRTEYDRQKLQHSKKSTKSKNQTRKASTSSTYQKQSEPFKKQKKSSVSINQPEEAVQELLRDVENLLQDLGLGLQDPLEMLMNWAKKVFQETFDDETYAKSGSKSPSETSKENESSKSRANDSSKDMWYELQEELERIKKTAKSEKPSSASIHRKNKSKIKVKDTEIEKELEFLKKKYRRF